MSLPIRCKFPGTQFILGLLQFVFSLFQFSLHFEEKQVDGWIHHGRPQLGHARLLDLLQVLNLGLEDATKHQLVIGKEFRKEKKFEALKKNEWSNAEFSNPGPQGVLPCMF